MKSPIIGTKLIWAMIYRRIATKTVAPSTDPRPVIMPFSNDNHIKRPGFLRTWTNSRFLRAFTSFVSSLRSRRSSFSILLWFSCFAIGAGFYFFYSVNVFILTFACEICY